MCGRYVLSQTGDLPSVFEISETRIPPRYNIAPTQEAPVVRMDTDDRRRLDTLRWGFFSALIIPRLCFAHKLRVSAPTGAGGQEYGHGKGWRTHRTAGCCPVTVR